MKSASPQERFAVAEKHAKLLRALLLHPGTAYKGDKFTDPANTHPTLYYVTDFEKNTYMNYLLDRKSVV